MVRAPFYDKSGVKKGAWDTEEGDKLRSYIQRYGHWNWRQLPKYAGMYRLAQTESISLIPEFLQNIVLFTYKF